MRGVFFDEDHARARRRRLLRDGFDATCRVASRSPARTTTRTIPWVVASDAPVVMLELLVEEYDGWLEPDEAPPPAAPLVLPDAPRRVKREL